MKKKRLLYFLLLLLLMVALIGYFQTNEDSGQVLDRNDDIILTDHARCRMDCRHINMQELKEIIGEGKINKSKSGMGSEGDQTVALEGISYQQQHIRVVLAPERDGLVIITVIDLEKEWPCHCP